VIKAGFSASLLQSSVSQDDDLLFNEHFLQLSVLKTVYAA